MKIKDESKPESKPINNNLLEQGRAYQIMYEYCVAKMHELMGIPKDRQGKPENPNVAIKLLENGITRDR